MNEETTEHGKSVNYSCYCSEKKNPASNRNNTHTQTETSNTHHTLRIKHYFVAFSFPYIPDITVTEEAA